MFNDVPRKIRNFLGVDKIAKNFFLGEKNELVLSEMKISYRSTMSKTEWKRLEVKLESKSVAGVCVINMMDYLRTVLEQLCKII